MKCTFYGVCGAHPNTNGPKFNRNTACVLIETNEFYLIFDAGSGLTNLSHNVTFKSKPIFLCFSHFHHDHVLGLPFFSALYSNNNPLYFIYPDTTKLNQVLTTFFSTTFFPITLKDFKNPPSFLTPKEALKYNVKLKTMLLNHPGGSYGYQLHHNNKTITYATDNEITTKNKSKLINFFHKSTLLIHDSYFFKEQKKEVKGWGHSFINDVLQIASDSHVNNLALFHHMPTRSTNFFKQVTSFTQDFITTNKSPITCILAKESCSITL